MKYLQSGAEEVPRNKSSMMLIKEPTRYGGVKQ
jgi:hypothetical protein